MSDPLQHASAPLGQPLRLFLRRMVLALVLATPLGLLTSLLIAWSGNPRSLGPFGIGVSPFAWLPDPDARWVYRVAHNRITSRWLFDVELPPGNYTPVDDVPDGIDLNAVLRATQERLIERGWRYADDAPAWTVPHRANMPIMYSFGFPMRCVAYATDFRGTQTAGLVIVPYRWAVIGGRHMAFLPIWSGLIVDTAVWAVPWAGILALVHPARARLRRRHGRCPACGYDLAGDFASGCPECGWNRADQLSGPDTE